MSKFFRLSFGFILLFLLPISAIAQNYTVQGKIVDEKTKEALAGVPVGVLEKSATGVFTNNNGEYKITLPKGNYSLIVRYVGYEDKKVKISLTKDIVENISLESSSIDLNEVVVSSRRVDENVAGVQTGVEKMSIQEINQLPVLFGERDVVKAIQLMPGVKSAGEGGTGFYVRGGSSDQNLVLLDNVGVYNASHLMGFFSAFNSDMVRDVTLYKGALPAQYGERLSSILDVQMRDGDNQDYHMSGGLGLISSKLNVEGPIKKGKSSFVIGARRTYADVIARALGSEDIKNTTLYFYDLNMKLNFQLSDKDRLTFTGYSGKDKLGISDVVDTDWGNTVGTVKWTRIMNHKWNSSTALIYNRYAYNVAVDMNQDLRISSLINDYALKQEFSFQQSQKSTWKFGLHTTYHDMAPGKFDVSEDKGVSKHLKNRYTWENGIYASNTLKATDRLEIMYGLRLSAFSVLGAGDFYNLDDNHEVIDTVSYKTGEFVKTYLNLEPRVSTAYRLNDESSIKAAYARTTQSMHLLSNPTFASPFDRWVSTSNNIKPQIADQFTLGYFRNFANNLFEFSAEVYYKDMRNQIDFKDNADTFTNDDVETELLFGKGRAYGIELMFKKRVGRLSGWIGYTLSKSEKQIDGINNNKWYDAVQDRTHDISLVAVYNLNEKWTLSGAWIYYTGNAVTYPSGKYQVDGKEVVYYTERNGYRAPDYHRLDLGATCVLKKTKKFYSELAFSLYNAYGRENAYMIEFRTNDDDPSKSTAYQYSLFRFVPSVSWNFKF
ncbi:MULTISPECIES: TonB-dependent receptor [unclassified Dysgonomonas]|uniref:TonB-dependent receptor n=1 Tax=unclassified Dysgonomonas TaxID=2630389 RepID=UPI00067FAC09|nr:MULTISPECIES: TonB-dependent receptor [unclassified Dysgonomonas]